MRSVLFVDPPAFCTTLEGLIAPELRSRPLAVAPPGADRATVLALSAEARLAGLERGMSVRKATRLCPDLIVLPPNPRLYAKASRALHDILRCYAPIIEPRGYGHAFLDLSGTSRLLGPPQDVAARIRRETHERIGLPLSVGVAVNKLVSQAAIRADRHALGVANGRTGGPVEWRADQQSSELLYVPAGNERGFLAPQPLEVLPELPSRMRIRLEDYQLDLIGEVAVIPENVLCAVFGREGRTLRARARGIDPRPVLPPERQAEFHMVHTLATDTNEVDVLHPLLRTMCERLGRRLRQRGLIAGRLRVEATYSDYTIVARAVSLSAGLLDVELWGAARRAFTQANSKRMTVRAVAITLDRLMEPEAQLQLWSDDQASGRADGRTEQHPSALQDSIDHIRTLYGAGALRRGGPLTAYQATTIFPNVAFPSSTR
jgi:DNA polymerase IV